MNPLAELERRVAALESAGGEILRSNNASLGPGGGVEEPGTVPEGGTENQALVKKSATNFDTTWKGPVVFSNGLTNTQTLAGGTGAGGSLILEAFSGVAAAGTITLGELGPTVHGLLTMSGGGSLVGTLAGGKVEPSELFLPSGALPGKLHIGRFALGEPNTPAQIKADRKAYQGLKNKAAWARLESSAEFHIFGISTSETQEGEAYWLTNIGAFTIKLVSESAEEPTEEFRFKLSVAEIELKPSQTVMIAYDSKTKRWRVLSGPSG